MADSLSSIFKNGLFVTTKNPNRDWTQISGRAGNHLYSIICEEYSNPEVALCAIVHSLAEIILCQTDKGKREKLMKCIPDAVHECVKRIESTHSEEPYEYEEEEGPEEEEQDDPEEDMVDARPVHGEVTNGKMVENPNGEDEEEDEEIGDPDPDEGFPDPWMPNKGNPEEAPVKENPAKMSGFQNKRKPKDK